MRVHINAKHCAEYLRIIGVDVSPAVESEWIQRETDEREARAARRAELKRSCGHFRTYETRVVSDAGSVIVTYCHDCQRAVNR